MQNQLNKFMLYTAHGGEIRVDVYLQDETVWLTKKVRAELFGVAKSTISEHLSNIFREQELDENSVVRNFRTTAADGKKYATNYNNLDAIISVGYRVNSARVSDIDKRLKKLDK